MGKMRGLNVLAAGMALLLTGGLVQAKEWTSVKIATEGAYEPWNLTLPGGKLGGFEIDLMDKLCPQMQLKCTYVVQNWDGMIASLNAGKVDVLMDAIVVTDERKKAVAFSIPYARTPASFAALKADLLPGQTGAKGVRTLSTTPADIAAGVADLQKALAGKTIGIASGTVYTDFIDTYFGKIATIREYTTSADAILDLTAGRLDAVFDDVTFLNSIMAQPGNQQVVFTGPELAGPIWGEGEALAFRHGDPELKAKFDAALKAAIADGTVKQLSEKWFKVDLTP
ncbi:transporter substrate-binding domain-containing protein [Pseudomonas oryzihabitans]|uniref:Octopine/nopaline transport system substrate-binding protein n=1 Tax=Pseudomonas oryzihabitans TaxID=47885 RepID=A0AAJ2BU49_9PSED|nr:transporter substrate-binding domain-containing protein [Pseudomonas psychrotolerans]MDR6236467.1 octopine/nopaline transport system substrate-binding protein [Pseudomonas psychrotolerans]MDR6354153.1 octopine/nopaline transport system substrate-binding protein [Pseudomonas psychrotolerans]